MAPRPPKVATPSLADKEEAKLNQLVTQAKRCLEQDLIQRHRVPFRRAASHVAQFQNSNHLQTRDAIEQRLRHDPELQKLCDKNGKLLDLSVMGRIREAVPQGGTQTWINQEEESVA